MKQILLVFVICCCLVGCNFFGCLWLKEREHAAELEKRAESYRKIVEGYQSHELIVWKHAQSLPDEFLQDFFPGAENLDALRAELPMEYEHYGEDGI